MLPNRPLAVFLLLTLLLGSVNSAVARIWTDRSGRQVEAEYRGSEGGKVRIQRTRDGKTFELPIERLSDSDQEFVQLLSKGTSQPPANPPNSSDSIITLSGLPMRLTVAEVEKIIKPIKIHAQGCGMATWRGESWGMYENYYGPIVVPWSSRKPVRVSAAYVYGRKPVEHHLIHFTVADIVFRRPETGDVLVRQEINSADTK